MWLQSTGGQTADDYLSQRTAQAVRRLPEGFMLLSTEHYAAVKVAQASLTKAAEGIDRTNERGLKASQNARTHTDLERADKSGQRDRGRTEGEETQHLKLPMRAGKH